MKRTTAVEGRKCEVETSALTATPRGQACSHLHLVTLETFELHRTKMSCGRESCEAYSIAKLLRIGGVSKLYFPTLISDFPSSKL
jgi:hypothetical protein